MNVNNILTYFSKWYTISLKYLFLYRYIYKDIKRDLSKLIFLINSIIFYCFVCYRIIIWIIYHLYLEIYNQHQKISISYQAWILFYQILYFIYFQELVKTLENKKKRKKGKL